VISAMLLCYVMASLALLVPPHTRLTSVLQPLFSRRPFVSVPDFLTPSVTDSLVADVESLRATMKPLAASAAHGSVEWFELLPRQPAVTDATSVSRSGRRQLLDLVSEIQSCIEEHANILLDANLTELRYAYYPCGGHYQRHVDAMHVGSVRREYSFILYLNTEWRPSDGGHLRVYEEDLTHIDIAPRAGTLVVFKSDVVPHEVRPTTSRRLAIVGWYHRRVEVEEVDESSLSPLALALLQHYREKGKTIKLTALPEPPQAQPRAQGSNSG